MAEMRTYDALRDRDEVFVTVACPCGGTESEYLIVAHGEEADFAPILEAHIAQDVADGIIGKEWLNG